MKLLLSTPSLVHAAHCQNVLLAAGIRAELRNTWLFGAIGEIPFRESAPQVWLVDDDASIRWVLEKALKGGGMAAKCFDQADNVLAALRSDAPDVLTSEEGWKLSPEERRQVDPVISALKAMDCRVILFVDPDPKFVEHVPDTGADGIEIYTGSFAAAFRTGSPDALLRACAATAAHATELGLLVNIGHDLNLKNLPPLIGALPPVAEASIGHELTADALVMGFAEAVRAYKRALSSGAPA